MFNWLFRRDNNYIGIDYGTTKSSIAILTGKQNEPQLTRLTENQQEWAMPSLVQLFYNHEAAGTVPSIEVNAVGWDARTQVEEAEEFLDNYAFYDRSKLSLGRQISKKHTHGDKKESKIGKKGSDY